MKDDEIIKALKRCSANYNCGDCPYYYDAEDCPDLLMNDALDLINRQKAEIERLEEMLDSSVSSERNTVDNIDYEKTESIKEFAHLVIDRSRNGVIQISDIPGLVKEMTEVNENE